MRYKNILVKIIGLLLVLFINLNKNQFKYLYKEINIVYFTSIISSNLYESNVEVSSTYIDVLDYYSYNDSLYIIPINEEVIIPSSGIISKISNNIIYLSTINGIIIIENIDKSLYHLYEYYESYSVLGNSKSYIIKTDVEYFKYKYRINYEKI